MAPFTDTAKQEIISMPRHAIELWKHPFTGIRTDIARRSLWPKILMKEILLGLGIIFIAYTTNALSKGALFSSDSRFLAICTISLVLILVVDGAWNAYQALAWYERGQVYATRKTILHGIDYERADPDDCGVKGWDDTFEHKYLIVPLPE